MTDRDTTFDRTDARTDRGRAVNLAPWIVLAACCVSFITYLALHTRELRLLGEWLASR